MRAVIVIVEGIAGPRDGVVTVRARRAAADAARIGPDVGRKVGMVVVDARVDHADDDVGGPGGHGPGLLGADVGAGRSGDGVDHLPGVLHPPQLAIARIVGDEIGLEDVVWLRVLHPAVSGQVANGVGHGAAHAQLSDLRVADVGELLIRLRVRLGDDLRHRLRIGSTADPHDQFTGDEVARSGASGPWNEG